ncbi:hypothetical protein OG389_09830 [Streptomyces sp. NBC_00435]|uniref:hypothetical protein n=1 Tax=Streptomyces sp. NBC_00435 TaxID=2903649 RepID=UPI002E24852C
MTQNRRHSSPVQHGFPHVETVRRSITALFRRLSGDGIRTYDTSFAPADATFSPVEDLYPGAHRVASAMVRALRLPDARIVVAFRAMEDAAAVELTAGPEYFVEVNDRFRTHRRDLAAALAHEVTHVLLHRLELRFPNTADNEILTDTAAAYLGAGWLLLDAYREDELTHQKLGYLTPEEFGYVLAKRGRFLGGEDLSAWFTSPQAYEAYVRGRSLADQDLRRAPLAAAGRPERRRYTRDRGHAPGRRHAPDRPAAPPAPGQGAAYRFEEHGDGLRVSFGCPVCEQRLRLPAGHGPLRARCGLCRTVLDCDT